MMPCWPFSKTSNNVASNELPGERSAACCSATRHYSVRRIMTEGVAPPHHHRLHHRHKLLRADWRSSRRHILQAVPYFLLGRLGWEHGDDLLPARGTAAFHTVETEEIKPLGHPGHARLVAVERPL